MGTAGLTLPARLAVLLDGAALTEINLGLSGAQVIRVNDSHYLKMARRSSEQDLEGELARLLWLQSRLPVPEITYWGEFGDTQYLLMTAIPGINTSDESLLGNLPLVIRLLAEGLRQIHSIPIANCPFDMSLDVKTAQGQRRVLANLVDEDDFDYERAGRTPQSAFEELLDTRPPREDLVFTHGDYCTPNILIDIERKVITGFVDLGRAGIADRYQDLALAQRSIIYNYGKTWVKPFFEAYGLTRIDHARIKFYRLMDEFF